MDTETKHTTKNLHTAKIGSQGTLFPQLEAKAYLNFAAVSPPSAVVREAVAGMLTDYARLGAGAIGGAVAQRDRLRGKLAALIGAQPQDIALTRNTSEGALDIAFSIPWTEGDGVVLFRGEFPANVSAWLQAAEVFRLNIFWIDAEEMTRPQGPEHLRDILKRENIKLVAVSAVQFQTGWRMPLENIGEATREAGALLFVDGTQACGCVPLDMKALRGIDFMACSGHKWLMGLEGAGFLYVRPDAMANLKPRLVGWLSGEDAFDFLMRGAGLIRYERPLRTRADVFEGSSPAALGYAALEASVDLLLELGVANIFGHVTAYLDALTEGLRSIGFQTTRRAGYESGIVSIPVEGGAQLGAVHRAMMAAGVACSTPDGHLRFAPHWPNNLDEIPQVLAALRAAWGSTGEGARG